MSVNDRSNFFRKYYKKINVAANNNNNKDKKPITYKVNKIEEIDKKNHIDENILIEEKDKKIVLDENISIEETIPTPSTKPVENKKEKYEEVKTETKDTLVTELSITKENEIKKDEVTKPQLEPDITYNIEITEEPELEISVINAIERIIRVDQHELDSIKYDIDVINKQTDDEIDIDEIELMENKLEDLLKKIEIIKKKYEKALNDSNKNNIIDENVIYDMLKDYKLTIDEMDKINTHEINENIKVINEYIGVVETILLIEKTTDEVKKNTEEKKEELNIRDTEFEKLKNEYEDIEKVEDDIEKFTKMQDSILKDLQYKIDNSETITKRMETETKRTLNLAKFVEAAVLYTTSKKIPPTNTGMFLKTSLLLGAVVAISNIVNVEEKQKEIINVSYTDYYKSIRQSMNDVSLMIDQINKAQDGISALKAKFTKELKDYEGLIPEYDKLIKNIDSMSKKLDEQKDIATESKKDFDKTMIKNNAKVKRLEELKKSSS